MKTILRLVTGVILLFVLICCDVHEFPEDNQRRVPLEVHLRFNTDMPDYKEVTYTRGTDTKIPYGGHDIRYMVNAYRMDNARAASRQADTSFVFTKPNDGRLDQTVILNLPEGSYDFKVWTDYVDNDSVEDKYYNTSDFEEIILADKSKHSGSNIYREAFRGYGNATVLDPLLYADHVAESIENEATIDMVRPMGRFKFISTDVEIFLTRLMTMMKEQGRLVEFNLNSDSKAGYKQLLQAINIDGYKVVFRYNAFMPCSFNMFTDKPADSWTGISFTSQMEIEPSYKEMVMGHDFVFVNGSETTLSISLEVYNDKNEKVSATNPIYVPIVRNKLTIVKGEFLTSTASGGVSINPGYEGPDYNIEIH